MTREEAEEYTQALGQVFGGGWRLILHAQRERIPDALGLSVDDWVTTRLGGYVRLSVSERQQVARQLTAAQEDGGEGLTQRQAAEVLGVDHSTVNDDLKGGRHRPGGNPPRAPAEVPGDLLKDPQLGGNPPPAEATRGAGTTAEGDEWYTPRWLFGALGIRFTADVCAAVDRTHSSVPAERHFTVEDDGLSQPWEGTVWCNPPYSRPEPWARRMIHHGDGLLLTHVPINAGWCVDVWEACAGLRLFQAMEFTRPDGRVQRPAWLLQLAAFGPVPTEALARLQPFGDAAANKRRVASPMWRRA